MVALILHHTTVSCTPRSWRSAAAADHPPSQSRPHQTYGSCCQILLPVSVKWEQQQTWDLSHPSRMWWSHKTSGDVLTSTLIRTGESVSGLLVVVDSRGTFWGGEGAETLSDATALPSSSGIWLCSLIFPSNVELAVPVNLLASKRKGIIYYKRKRFKLCIY